MTPFDTIEEVSKEITSKLNSNTDKKSIALLYAFNATGKTRLSVELNKKNIIFEENVEFEETEDYDKANLKIFSYNAFIEDLFYWDNNNYVLRFNSHWLFEFIEVQDLEGKIKDIYKEITNSKIEPEFNYTNESVTFPIINEIDYENKNKKPIKISKSEESLFIWSVYFSVLELAIESLNTDEENRLTKKFNNLELIVIDDPVSSIDDTGIITLAVKLFKLIKSYNGNQVSFLLTTHHALYYNVLFNSFSRLPKAEAKKYFYILSKNNSNQFILDPKEKYSIFGYHLSIIELIKKNIDEGTIERYHFNLFRSLLEKTANFLGYNSIDDCILGDNKEEYIRLINMYSHGVISELEFNEVQSNNIDSFTECFNQFLVNFKYK